MAAPPHFKVKGSVSLFPRSQWVTGVAASATIPYAAPKEYLKRYRVQPNSRRGP
jgi:hypothetical protein